MIAGAASVTPTTSASADRRRNNIEQFGESEKLPGAVVEKLLTVAAKNQ